MIDDKELLSPKDDERMLLELAAKAAGIEITWENSHHFPERIEYFRGLPNYYQWNPLTDDDDALRLAVRLEISIEIGNDISAAQAPSNNEFQSYFYCAQTHGNDPYAATRRAIVRAAASIGEKL